MNGSARRIVFALGAAALALSLAGCGGGNTQDLQQWVAHIKARPGSKIPPVPKPTPYKAFKYNAGALRSPFVAAAAPQNNVRPNFHRKKQYLEQFPLDSLKFVGEVAMGGTTYALIEDPNGMVHRVSRGDYMGQNNGRIRAVLPDSIKLEEIVPNGNGGWQRRPTSLALEQKSGG